MAVYRTESEIPITFGNCFLQESALVDPSKRKGLPKGQLSSLATRFIQVGEGEMTVPKSAVCPDGGIVPVKAPPPFGNCSTIEQARAAYTEWRGGIFQAPTSSWYF